MRFCLSSFSFVFFWKSHNAVKEQKIYEAGNKNPVKEVKKDLSIKMKVVKIPQIRINVKIIFDFSHGKFMIANFSFATYNNAIVGIDKTNPIIIVVKNTGKKEANDDNFWFFTKANNDQNKIGEAIIVITQIR